MSTPAISVERVLAPSDEARHLIDELDAELLQGYEPEQRGLTTLAQRVAAASRSFQLSRR